MIEKREDEIHTEEGEINELFSLVDFTPPSKNTEMVLGQLVRLDSGEGFGVTYPGNPIPVPCLSTIPLDESGLNRQVVLMFLEGPSPKPVAIGLIHNSEHVESTPREVIVDNERLVIQGKKEVELRCGKASILLREDGKVVIKGTNLISRSSGSNKVKGASVSLN